MFKKVLIANRGEIAVRIIKTLRRLGIASVAVYSDADRFALHVRQADKAIRLGPAQASESYLNVEAVIAACKETGLKPSIPAMAFSRKISALPSGYRPKASPLSARHRRISPALA